MRALITRLALLMVVATVGARPVQAQNYDGDGIVRVGLFAQGTWLDINQTLPAAGNTEFSGFAGGISAGYDFWRTSRFVLGVEIDAAIGDLGDSILPVSYGFDYLATARGRAGVYVHPNWLVYGTVGVAWLGFEAQSTLTGDKASDTMTGLAVGGGTEVDWGHLIFFGEYLYTDFGSRNFVVDATTQRVDIDGHVARFGIKYKIGHDFYYHDDVRPLK